MKIYRNISYTMFSNSFLLVNEETKEAAIIDPSQKLIEFENIIEKEELQVKKLLLTHGHYDHIGALYHYKEKYQAKIYAGQNEKRLLEDPNLNLSGSISVYCDGFLKEGDVLEDFDLKVLETPGHTAGSITFLGKEDMFVGDTIFQNSVGRWDLPTGNLDDLILSVRKLLLTDTKDIRIHSGHGPSTSKHYEREHNPFMKG